MWDPEKWYWRTYFQSRNRDRDVENKHMNTKGGSGDGMNGETGSDGYSTAVYKIDN